MKRMIYKLKRRTLLLKDGKEEKYFMCTKLKFRIKPSEPRAGWEGKEGN